MKKTGLAFCMVLTLALLQAEDGYRLWLRYDRITDHQLLEQYRKQISGIHFTSQSPVLSSARTELLNGLQGLLGKKIPVQQSISNGCILAGTSADESIHSLLAPNEWKELGKEGFVIRSLRYNKSNVILLAGNSDVSTLYAVFHLLRLLQTQEGIQQLRISSRPRIEHRILNHWDNLNRHVERGYAGISIWNWHQLPEYIDRRYIDYARANASIGINGTVLTNVNASALVLTKDYLQKVAALEKIFRSYGIKVYLTARFSAPIEIGGLKTADPLNHEVQEWWKRKATEIYQNIPDFGGFLVKANSEGQPGPQNYGRTHVDGANMLADAVAPYGGIVMWRAFVYSNEVPEDRVKQAYNEFKPLDGQFRKNVLVQVKNGPLDFQPREPVSPLFGSMPQTPLMMEFQITQEYLGQGTHLVYEAPLFKEALDADTYTNGKGSTVARIIDGTSGKYDFTGMAGVSNIGNERNWTNHPFGQANWYALGRLAWNHDLSSEKIATEWIRQTFTNNTRAVNTIQKIMLASREAVVNYMSPLGLHHIMGTGHHYGPAPWINNAGRADWNPVYYHRADSIGIGFERTSSGSNAVAQYAPEIRKELEAIQTCPEKYLLWFHHVPWTYNMKSGRNLWDELCHLYNAGVDTVRWMEQQWNSLKSNIDEERWQEVKMLLAIQETEAVWWRNACLLYFQTFSKMQIPPQYEKPDQSLEYYRSLRFPYAPGNG